ncbi:MurR/RpiR family transcriptional regulator, partial [Lactiplantibacillus plantarum]|nr:MurR/RpiR family transcriptional regulator [Lactiplantibacillus plantarum]MCZ2275370.1 MurR/RpiR family transcriptional regulator [Lactiplantibacillus plantarum]
MFSYEQLEKYNETDVEIYRYVINNMDRVGYMSIRELAHELHVSTSTILRFCLKNGFEGYRDFKRALKRGCDITSLCISKWDEKPNFGFSSH